MITPDSDLPCLYSVFDRAVHKYMSPMIFKNDGEAKKALLSALERPSSWVARRCAQLSLHRLAVWDDDSGTITFHEPEMVLSSTELIEAKEALDEKHSFRLDLAKVLVEQNVDSAALQRVYHVYYDESELYPIERTLLGLPSITNAQAKGEENG